jgi:hypothetical protein
MGEFLWVFNPFALPPWNKSGLGGFREETILGERSKNEKDFINFTMWIVVCFLCYGPGAEFQSAWKSNSGIVC